MGEVRKGTNCEWTSDELIASNDDLDRAVGEAVRSKPHRRNFLQNIKYYLRKLRKWWRSL